MKSEKNKKNKIFYILFLAMLLLLCSSIFHGCKKKCSREKLPKFESPIIAELEVESKNTSLQFNTETRFLDSTEYNMFFTNPVINFKTNSVIFLNEEITKDRKIYINGFKFSLKENFNEYILSINVCTSKKIGSHGKYQERVIQKVLLLEKLSPKQLITQIKHE